MPVPTNVDVVNVLKEFYDGQKIGNTLFRNSPLLEKIQKRRVGGSKYPVPFMTSGSGASCGSMTVFKKNIQKWGKTHNMKVDYKQLFGGFVVSDKELSASQKEAGGFVDLLTLKSFASLEGLRKTFAVSLYGDGTGRLGRITEKVDASADTITVENGVVYGIGIGSPLIVKDTSNPSGDVSACVLSIDTGDNTSVIKLDKTITTPIAKGKGEVYLDGCTDSNGALIPVGLEGWIPTVGNRTGSEWESYIKKQFYGVDRSTYVSRLCGQFVKKESSESYSDAISRLFAKVRTQGGVPDLIILNPADYAELMKETKNQLQYMQSVNGVNKSEKNEITKGISQFRFAFSTSWIENVIDDPFCPKGKAYVLDSSVVAFIALSNTAGIVNASNSTVQAGTPEVTDGVKVPQNYIFNFDDFISVTPEDTDEGAGLRCIEQIFGNFILTNPAHCGVVVFE